MPAPDVQYVLDSSVECGHIGGDTHFYLMELAPNANAIVDGYEHPAEHDPNVSHWSRLTDMGLAFEQEYLRWRATSPRDMHLASYQGLRTVPYTFREMSRTAASHIVDHGFTGMTPAALRHLEERFEFSRTLQIMRRAMHRASRDFAGADRRDMRLMDAAVNNKFDANRLAYEQTLARLRENIADREWIEAVPYERHDIWADDPASARHVKDTEARLRERVKQERKVIKRSVKFLNRLIGTDTTRMFIGGDRIRFEGQHAIYELQKMSNLMQSHGGFRALSVFDKEHPELLLCQLCINTPNVPLLDHVASLVMHIKAGEEDQILKIGNASTIHERAYDREWLVPYLPMKRDPNAPLDLDRMIMGAAFRTDPETERRREAMRHVTSKHIFREVIADFLPVANAAALTFGRDRFDCVWPPALDLEVVAA